MHIAPNSIIKWASLLDGLRLVSALLLAGVSTLSTLEAAVLNDNFLNRTRIDGNLLSLSSSSLGATGERNEPKHAGVDGGASLWWQWHPPEEGYVLIDTTGSAFNTTLAVYFGKDLNVLDTIASNNDTTNSTTSLVGFDADPQRDYPIAVDGVQGASGEIKLNLRLFTFPIIINQPESVDATDGDNATFRVAALGKNPLSFQWKFKGQNLPGEIGPSLKLHSVTKQLAGLYSVVIRNSYGEINSAAALLTVLARPQITKQPLDAISEPGDNLTLSVEAIGEQPLAYQWSFQPTALLPATPLTGKNASQIILPNISTDESGFYVVRVANAAGSVTSHPAKVVVEPRPPRILEALTNRVVIVGTNVDFSAEVKGYRPLEFRWFKDNVPLANQTNSRLFLLSVTTNDTGLYGFEASNRYGRTRSQDARLTVEPRPPNDNFQSRIDVSFETNIVFGFNKNGTREQGEPAHAGQVASHSVWWTYHATNRGVVTIDLEKSAIDTVLAVYTGTNVNRLQIVGTNDDAQDEETGATMRQTSKLKFVVEPGMEYSVAVDGKNGQETDWRANSNRGGIGLKVNFNPDFGAPFFLGKLDGFFFLLGGLFGEGCGQGRFVLKADGLVPFAYQWQYSLLCLPEGPGTTWLNIPCRPTNEWVNIPNATNDTLVLGNLTVEHTGQIRLVASNIGVPGSITSSPARIVVSPLPLITNQPAGFTTRECVRKELQFGVAGGCYPFAIEWYFKGRLLPGETNKSLVFNNGQSPQSGGYYAVARNRYGGTTSQVAQVVFEALPIIKTQPAPLGRVATDCLPVRFSVEMEPSCRVNSFQWLRNAIVIPGETNQSLQLFATAETAGDYSVRIFNEFASTNSRSVRLEVNANPDISEHPEYPRPRRVLSGTTFTNSVRVTSGCSQLTFQWRRNGLPVPIDANHFALTNGFLVIQNASTADSGRYDVIVSSRTGSTTSRSGEIVVLGPPPNDNFVNRIVLNTLVAPIGATNYYVTETRGSNYFGTPESGEPPHARQSAQRSVWWTWTSPTPSLVTVDLSGSDFDTLLGVYTGDRVDDLLSVAFDDQGGLNGASKVTFLAARGRKLHFAVDGSHGDEGIIAMTLKAQEILSPPVIIAQPRSIAATNGATVSFAVEAFGSPDIHYEWRFNGLPIPAATNASITIGNLRAEHEGNYTVVLTNEFGSITSLIARLTFGTIIEGQVTDATNRRGVPDARVSVGNIFTNTDANGNYTLIGVRPGAAKADFDANKRLVRLKEQVLFKNLSTSSRVTLRCEKEGYFPFEDAQFEVPQGQTVTNKISLSPEISGLRFVVNWGLRPADLDAHLLVPNIEGTNYHVQYIEADRGRENSPPFAVLDLDVRDSFGPETVTIHQFVDGVYRFYVRKFDPLAQGDLSQSSAIVRVYDSRGLYGTRVVPTNGSGSVWHVADFDGAKRSLTWVDQVLTADPLPSQAGRVSVMEAGPLLRATSSRLNAVDPPVSNATFRWDFGDGEFSSSVNPSHSYHAPGSYTVVLTMTLPGGASTSETKTNFITVYNEAPVVTLSDPPQGTLYRVGLTIPLVAEAKDFDGEIRRVEFFRLEAEQTNRLEQATAAPYRLVLSDLQPGSYSFVARATDDFGAVGTSQVVTVKVLDLAGDILIIRNFADAEIDQLVDYLGQVKLPDEVFGDRDVAVRVLDQRGLYFDLIREFKLIIWDDLGALEPGLNDTTVKLLGQTKQSGIPLYLIGEHLATTAFQLTDAFDTWQQLSQLSLPEGTLEPGLFELRNTRPRHPLFSERFGSVSPFTYDHLVERVHLVSTNNDVVAQIEGNPVMLQRPPFAEPDFGQPRSIIQNFRVVTGEDSDSLEQRRRLFLNAVGWLLRLTDCRTIGLAVTCENTPVIGRVGEPLTFSTLVTQIGECTVGGTLLTCVLSPSLDLQSYEVVPISSTADPSTVRQEPANHTLVTRFSTLSRATTFRVTVTAIPSVAGIVTNTATLFLGALESDLFHCEHVAVIASADCTRRATLRAEVTNNSEINLVASIPPGCNFRLQSSVDFLAWETEVEIAPTVQEFRFPLPHSLSSRRFYRLSSEP